MTSSLLSKDGRRFVSSVANREYEDETLRFLGKFLFNIVHTELKIEKTVLLKYLQEKENSNTTSRTTKCHYLGAGCEEYKEIERKRM